MVKTTKTTTPKTASKTASKATKTVAPIVEAAAPVVETTAPVVETVAPVVEEPVSTVFGQFTDFMAKLQAVSASMSSIRTEFRGIERQVTRELKAAAKINAKRKRKTGNRAPSGFVKPTLISNELAGFLGKPEGTEMARTGLLKLKKDDELTYFNLQKYMSPHFAKASDKIAAATAAV